jgi:hypothetical protein
MIVMVEDKMYNNKLDVIKIFFDDKKEKKEILEMMKKQDFFVSVPSIKEGDNV